MLACAMCATTLASKFSHLLSASSLLYTSSDMSGSLQPHRASIDIWVSILSPATAQPIDARLHFICTSCPARASRWKKKKKREWDRRRRSHLRGELWRTQHRQRVSVRHEHGARQLLRKTGRNTKLVLVSLQVLYSQSFSTFSMLLFAEQHFSRLFVFFFFVSAVAFIEGTACALAERCECSVFTLLAWYGIRVRQCFDFVFYIRPSYRIHFMCSSVVRYSRRAQRYIHFLCAHLLSIASSIKFYLLRKFNKFIIIICLKLAFTHTHGEYGVVTPKAVMRRAYAKNGLTYWQSYSMCSPPRLSIVHQCGIWLDVFPVIFSLFWATQPHRSCRHRKWKTYFSLEWLFLPAQDTRRFCRENEKCFVRGALTFQCLWALSPTTFSNRIKIAMNKTRVPFPIFPSIDSCPLFSEHWGARFHWKHPNFDVCSLAVFVSTQNNNFLSVCIKREQSFSFAVSSFFRPVSVNISIEVVVVWWWWWWQRQLLHSPRLDLVVHDTIFASFVRFWFSYSMKEHNNNNQTVKHFPLRAVERKSKSKNKIQ